MPDLPQPQPDTAIIGFSGIDEGMAAFQRTARDIEIDPGTDASGRPARAFLGIERVLSDVVR